MAGHHAVVPMGRIEQVILLIRGHKVILDKDLAALYGVATGNLNKAVTRNIERFPADFMFQLTAGEFVKLEIPFWNIKLGWDAQAPSGVDGAGRCNAL